MMKFIYPVLFFLELTALIFSIAMNYLKIRAIEPVYWNVFLNDISLSTYEMLLSLLVPALLTFLAFRSKKIELICQITKRGTVLLLLLILLFVPLNFTSIIAFILICVIAFFRIFSCFSFAIPECQLSGRKMAVLTVAGGVAGAVYGSYLQFYDVYRLALANSDWGEYVVAYKELASGLFNCPIWKFLNTGGHFNLLPNIFGTLLFSVTPEPFAIFILNSLVIYSAIPCTYFAARSNKVAPLPALIFSLALLFHFTLANLNTCIFYGYHPNIYLIPLFLLFWGFFCQKRYRIAAVFMLLSLLVQETFAVLWFGFGLFLLLFQRKKQQIIGIVIMLFMTGWFFFITRYVMSLGDAKNAVQYHQMFHYSNLGNSVLEILLSPFTRSAVFFRELFAVENFYFALILFAGFPAIWFYPKLLILTVLPFVGVFLLNNNDLSNVAMQYQLEIFLVLVAASVSGLAVMQQRSQKHLTTILLTSLFALTVCGCFMGRLPWGGYSGMPAEKSCCLKKIALIKQVIPDGCKIQTTLAYQSHFIGRNIMCNFSENKIDPDADFIILPERDLFLRSENIADLVKQIIYSNKWKITAIDPEIHRVLVVERIK